MIVARFQVRVRVFSEEIVDMMISNHAQVV